MRSQELHNLYVYKILFGQSKQFGRDERECSTCEERRNAHRILVGNCEGGK
jgi:hypothetical protein